MPDTLSGSRCSGTRTLRWAAVVVPTAVILTGAFGTTGAYAAAGGNAAVPSAAGANANHGVGNGVGNGNDKHVDVTATPVVSTTTTTTSTTTVTAAATATTQDASTSSSTASHQVDCTATPSDPLCSEQPLSTADQNTGGANGQCPGGPYCSTRDGSPSGNGNQTQGQHTGEPCAGCVGKADNKNPKGQNPDGSDRNAGYECDRNHGIGRSNPAHTGCKSTPPPTVCTAPNTMVNGVCTPPTANCTTNPTAASCDNSGGDTACTPTQANGFCSTVLGEKVTRKPTVLGQKVTRKSTVLGEKVTRKPTVQGEKVTRKPSVQGEQVAKAPASLPFTGANVAVLLLAAAAGLMTGTALLVAGRRRRAL